MSGQLNLEGVEFKVQIDPSVLIEIQAQELKVHIKEYSWKKRALIIEQIDLGKLQVQIIEDKKINVPDSPSSSQHWMTTVPAFQLQRLSIEEGELRYVLKTKKGQQGSLFVTDIQAEISDFGSRERFSPARVNFMAFAKLDHQGHAVLKGEFDLYAQDNHDLLNIKVDNQNLNVLNPLIFALENIALRGNVTAIETSLELHTGHLTGSLWAKYHDLNIEYKRGPENENSEVFIKNMLILFMSKQESLQDGQAYILAPINYQRLPNQNLIQFLLAALLQGVSKVIGV